MSTLELRALTKQFAGVTAVSNVSLSVGEGEFVCILGPSGCGKSTTLRMIGGFEEATDGDVLIDGVSVVDIPPNKRPTAMVFQRYTLWPHMRIDANIAFGLQLRHLPQKEINREVHGALQLVGLAGYEKRYPAQLSGGEQQRVALARALVLKPKILLLDEPFSNLDALLRVHLREQLHDIQRQVGITTIFVTHDQEEALSLADRIAIMNAGRLEQLDVPSQIYAFPRTLFVADFIGQMNILSARREDAAIRVGDYLLAAPADLPTGDSLQIAIRPEDLQIVPENQDTSSGALWRGKVDQSIDLGHYRKVTVIAPGLFLEEGQAQAYRVKVYASKSREYQEGQSITLFPSRYLIYGAGDKPIQVLNRTFQNA